MPTERSTGSRAGAFRVSFDAYLKDFGTTVTIRKTTETKDAMNRVISTSVATSKANADIQWISKQDLMYQNLGRAKVGDGQIFFEYNQDIDLHDELVFNSVRYRFVEQIEGEVVGGDVTYIGYVIRKNDQV